MAVDHDYLLAGEIYNHVALLPCIGPLLLGVLALSVSLEIGQAPHRFISDCFKSLLPASSGMMSATAECCSSSLHCDRLLAFGGWLPSGLACAGSLFPMVCFGTVAAEIKRKAPNALTGMPAIHAAGR